MFLMNPKFNDAMNHDFKSLLRRRDPNINTRESWEPKRESQHHLKNGSNSQITAKLSVKEIFVSPYISDNCTPTWRKCSLFHMADFLT